MERQIADFRGQVEAKSRRAANPAKNPSICCNEDLPRRISKAHQLSARKTKTISPPARIR
jgi:hypothetical protein